MIQTLSDVVRKRGELLALLDSGNQDGAFYKESVMDAVVVWPDNVAHQCLGLQYLFDTQFAPGLLPGCGMAIGNEMLHDGKSYLTLSHSVMALNAAAIYRSRQQERAMAQWDKDKCDYDNRVGAFLSRLRTESPKVAEHIDPGYDENARLWRSSSVGMDFVSLPNANFLSRLQRVRDALAEHQSLREEASALHTELTPYADLAEFMMNIRKELGRKGHTDVRGGMFRMSSPAASGGASLYFPGPGDCLRNAVPGAEVLVMAGCEVGTLGANVVFVSGGSTPGQRSCILSWKTPFYAQMQEALDQATEHHALWHAIAESGFPDEGFREWGQTIEQLKRRVIDSVVGELVSTRVLGFVLNMCGESRTAHLWPIISQSVADAHAELLAAEGLEVHRTTYQEVFLEGTGGRCYFANLVLNPDSA